MFRRFLSMLVLIGAATAAVAFGPHATQSDADAEVIATERGRSSGGPKEIPAAFSASTRPR